MSQIHAHLMATGQFDSFWVRKLLKFYWDFGDVDFIRDIKIFWVFSALILLSSAIRGFHAPPGCGALFE